MRHFLTLHVCGLLLSLTAHGGLRCHAQAPAGDLVQLVIDALNEHAR